MVVVSDGWGKNLAVPLTETVMSVTCEGKMASRGVLTCRPNSHPFQERTLILDQPVKIGRAVARSKPAADNAVFDCKVLSRNHALLWYDTGKFYLQDTNSSNGTFVNNHRLSKGSELSSPREVCSGDIVQFGVDVLENSRKVTHGCIIATLRLFLPDGKEAKASPSAVNSEDTVPAEDLCTLNTYLQEALMRETQLERKLSTLQKLIENLRSSSDSGFQALVEEDRLLSRVQILENQLRVYSKTVKPDALQQEIQKLLDDKSSYQDTAKSEIQAILDEKLEAVVLMQSLKDSVSDLQLQCETLKHQLTESQQDLRDLAQKYSQQTVKFDAAEQEHRKQYQELEQEKEKLQEQLYKQFIELKNIKGENKFLHMSLSDNPRLGYNSENTDNVDEFKKEIELEKNNHSDTIFEAENNTVQMMSDSEEKEKENKLHNNQLSIKNCQVGDVIKDHNDKPEDQIETDEPEGLQKMEWEARQNEKCEVNGVAIQEEEEIQPWTGKETLAELGAQLAKLEQDSACDESDLFERIEQCKRLSQRVEELEEELVELRERFSQCNMERTRLSLDLRGMQTGSGQVIASKFLWPSMVVLFALFAFVWLQS